jgi:hypothetical protein
MGKLGLGKVGRFLMAGVVFYVLPLQLAPGQPPRLMPTVSFLRGKEK